MLGRRQDFNPGPGQGRVASRGFPGRRIARDVAALFGPAESVRGRSCDPDGRDLKPTRSAPRSPQVDTTRFRPSGFFAFRTPLLPFDELLAWGEGLQAPGRAAQDPA